MNWICRFRETHLSFFVPKDFLLQSSSEAIDGLFHGGSDSPTLNAIDPLSQQRVQITKCLSWKSKSSRTESIAQLIEQIELTRRLSHESVRRVLLWYIADRSLYSISPQIQFNLRQAIQTQRFPIERIRSLASQIISATLYLHSLGISTLTPWYTTNIELTEDERIRLCSPTKVNGDVLHLWRHAPERLLRSILGERHSDVSKEDVWAIGCIVVEMMIQTVLFRPSNDDASLQLFSIVRLVGGLSKELFDRLPVHIKPLFASLKFDVHQRRLEHVLKQIFHQYQISALEHRFNHELFQLLSQIFQFSTTKRLPLASTLEHPFFSMEPMKTPMRLSQRKSSSTANVEDLIRSTIRLHLEQSRWMLTLKERCLLELLLHLKEFSTDQLELSRTLLTELGRLRNFFFFLTSHDLPVDILVTG